MAKFPSQRKIIYEAPDISKTTMSSVGHINVFKDLSILNRRGYAQTTKKGVPFVVQAKVDWYLQDDLGTGPATAPGSDLQATMKMTGVQNNWVIKNAAVKWHAALQAMRKKAGVTKSMVGTYAHEIRYNYDVADDTWLNSIDGDGNAFTGGTWDVTRFADAQDASYQLKLVGSAVSEEVSTGVSVLQLGTSYLASRRQPDTDSNEGIDESPALFSHLNDLLAPNEDGRSDEVIAFTRDDGDNVPYDEYTGETDPDISEAVELGRAVAGFGNAYGSTIMEIPFGLADLRAQAHDAASTNTTFNGLIALEVLDIYEMQG